MNYLFLHLTFVLFSISGLMQKFAAQQTPFSMKFFMFYGLELLILGIYAILWQQILKKFKLTTAYANKASTIIWGIIFGVIFFKEAITINKIIGALIVIAGIVIFATGEKKYD